MFFALACFALFAHAGEFFCTLHCTEHWHDCVENDGGMTKNFANCQLQYGLCMNACRPSGTPEVAEPTEGKWGNWEDEVSSAPEPENLQGEFFCTLHCTEHLHDCVENDGGLTKNFANCNLNYGLCLNACRPSGTPEEDESASAPEISLQAPEKLQGEFFCTLHCTEHLHDCVENDGGLTKNFANCNLNYGLCLNACRPSGTPEEEDESASAPETGLQAPEILQAVDPFKPLTKTVCAPLFRATAADLWKAIKWVCGKGGMTCSPTSPPMECRAAEDKTGWHLQKWATYVFTKYYSTVAPICDPRIATLTKNPEWKQCVFPGAVASSAFEETLPAIAPKFAEE